MSTVEIALMGCSGDTTGTAPTTTSGYFGLVLNQHAINMSLTAPSNTIQLTATAINTNGEPLLGAGQAIFRAIDSSVTVSPTGLVTAHFVTNGGTEVIATLQQGNGTRADTAYIKVTVPAPASGLMTFSIQPAVGDSAIRTSGNQYFPTVTAMDSAHHAVDFNFRTDTNGLVYWTKSSNPVTTVGATQCCGNWPLSAADGFGFIDTGHVTLYAGSWVYGVTVQDSLKMLVGWPNQIFSELGEDPATFYGIEYYIGVGGQVDLVYDGGQDDLDIVFDDSTAVDSVFSAFAGGYTGSGNMHFSKDGGVLLARGFPIAGVYRFWNRLYPTLFGKVYVMKNLTR